MTDPKSDDAKKALAAYKAAGRRERRGRISISLTLLLSFGGLLTVSILAVLAMAVLGSARNTVSLLQDKANLAVDMIVHEISRHMQSAEAQAEFVAKAIESGKVDPTSEKEMRKLLFGAMAADRAINAVLLFRPNAIAFAADRSTAPARSYRIDFGTDRSVHMALAEGRTSKKARWGPPIHRPEIAATILNLRRPVWKNGEFAGVVVVGITVRTLSTYLKKSQQGRDGDVFVLYGQHHVIAHRHMAAGYAGMSVNQPLPALANFKDRILARMWDETVRVEPRANARPPTLVRVIELDDVGHVFLFRKITHYTATPWYAGAYFRGDVIGKELERLRNSAIAGLICLLIAIIVSFFIGKRLAKPIARLSTSARKVSEMKLDDVGVLPHSRVRELDDQSTTFNSMVGALRWFQAYVPKPLVRQLVRDGDLSKLTSDRRRLTVMFTDIAGYSGLSEGKGAAEVAALLNQHFTIVAGAVEAEGGTIDKFIGDSAMAFWGAPEKQKNRAIRACRAALAIRRGIAADNRARAARGEPPVRMRIGIHSGEATVGNIGPPDRVNYTVVGDDVNVAQRLEQLGKKVSPDEDVAISVSAATVTDLEDLFEVTPVGELDVKGRAQPVAVYRLVDGPDAPETSLAKPSPALATSAG